MVYGYGDAQQPASVVLCGARGLRLGLLGMSAKVVGYTVRAQPHQRLVPGLRASAGATQGLKAQQGPTLAKTVVGGWVAVSHVVVLVERLVVDALWR